MVEKFLTQTSSHRLGEADLNDWEPHGGQGVKDADPLDESCAMALGIRWIQSIFVDAQVKPFLDFLGYLRRGGNKICKKYFGLWGVCK